MLEAIEKILFRIADEIKKNSLVERRPLLQIGTAGSILATLIPSEAEAVENYDLSYLWHNNLEAVLDYQAEVARILGPEVEQKLHLVKGKSGNFGLIYDRNGTKEQTERTAKHHHKLLHDAELDPAVAIKDEGYHSLFNIEYQREKTVDNLKEAFQTVYRTLGSEVGKDLVIEKVNGTDGEHALVWRRRGEESSTRSITQRHAELLKGKLLMGKKFSLFTIRETNNPAEYGETSFLNEDEPPVKPRSKLPEPPNRRETSSALEKTIERYVKSQRTNNERTAWSVYDFTTGEKLVSINENVPFQCASMVKPLVALAYFHLVRQKRLIYNSLTKRYMEEMIQKSDNASTNWIMQQIGGPQAVQRILNRQYRNIFQNTSVVEYIPNGGRTYQNKASAHDYSRFLYALWNDEIPYAREIRRLMALPGRDRLYTGARRVPTGTLVYNKTGTTARLCGDMGILYARDRNGRRCAYTVVGIVQKNHRAANYTTWARRQAEMIREVSNIVYDHMRERHSLI